MSSYLNAGSRTTLALCFLLVTLFICPHQTATQETNSDAWSDWISYVYAMREDGSARVTVASYILVDTPTAEYLQNRFDQNKESQLEVAQQTIIAQELAIADKLGRRLSSTDGPLFLQIRRMENLVVLETSWTWSNFAVRKANSWVIDVLTVIPVTLEEKGNLTVMIPKSFDIISVSLKEDERLVLQDGTAIVWKGPRQNIAPIVEYSTFWDRYQLWIGGAIGAILAIVVILVYRRRRPLRLRRTKKHWKEYPQTFCAHCGTEIPYGYGAAYCIECGKPIRRKV